MLSQEALSNMREYLIGGTDFLVKVRKSLDNTEGLFKYLDERYKHTVDKTTDLEKITQDFMGKMKSVLGVDPNGEFTIETCFSLLGTKIAELEDGMKKSEKEINELKKETAEGAHQGLANESHFALLKKKIAEYAEQEQMMKQIMEILYASGSGNAIIQDVYGASKCKNLVDLEVQKNKLKILKLQDGVLSGNITDGEYQFQFKELTSKSDSIKSNTKRERVTDKQYEEFHTIDKEFKILSEKVLSTVKEEGLERLFVLTPKDYNSKNFMNSRKETFNKNEMLAKVVLGEELPYKNLIDAFKKACENPTQDNLGSLRSQAMKFINTTGKNAGSITQNDMLLVISFLAVNNALTPEDCIACANVGVHDPLLITLKVNPDVIEQAMRIDILTPNQAESDEKPNRGTPPVKGFGNQLIEQCKKHQKFARSDDKFRDTAELLKSLLEKVTNENKAALADVTTEQVVSSHINR